MSIVTISDALASEMVSKAWASQPIQCGCGNTGGKIYALSTRPGIFKCGVCRGQFSKHSVCALGRPRLTDRQIVLAAFMFVSAKNGISSCEMARVLGVQQGTAYALISKFRRAIYESYSKTTLSGVVEIDGAFFGGHVRHQNKVESGKTRRLGRYHYKDRKTVVVLKQRMGKTLTFIGDRESDALQFVQERVEAGAVIQVDQAHAWDSLKDLYEMLRINHRWSFASNSTHTNNAESFFAGLRRAQNGTYHRISGRNLHLYAQEIAWRRDQREATAQEMIEALLGVMTAPRLRAPVDGLR